MQGDFSRIPNGSTRRFSRILMQQGRVQLDADWNEQAEITARRLESYTSDVVGLAGAPLAEGGFEIAAHHSLRFEGLGEHAATSPEHHFAFPGSEAFTIETWLNPAAGGPVWAAVDEQGHSSYSLVLEPQGTLYFERAEVTGARVGVRTAEPVAWSPFTYILVMHHGHAVTIYVDGISRGHAEGFGRAPEHRSHFVIGATSHGAASHSFAGEIGPVYIWSGALRESEISDHLSGNIVPGPSLAAAWRFDGPKSKIIADISGKGRDLHLKPGKTGHDPVRSGNLWIGDGRYYVKGALCENERRRVFSDQPHYPGASLPSRHGLYLVYLEAWERFVSAIEAPGIREIALGGADTTVRLEQVWRVGLLAGSSHEIPEWPDFERRHSDEGRMAARHAPFGTPLENQLYRVEIHQAGRAASGAQAGVEATVQLPGQLEIKSALPPEWKPGVALALWSAHGRRSKPDLATISSIDAAGLISLDKLPPQLAQDAVVSIHPVPTCKWSRENASVAFPVTDLDKTLNKLVIEAPSNDPRTLSPGDWIEVGDDHSAILGRPFSLRQIRKFDPDSSEVYIDSIPAGFAITAGKHPFLRRWDQTKASSPLASGEIAMVAGEWLQLESGIEVKFGNDWFRTGDYWTIPARSLLNSIDWPTDDHGPVARRPDGVHRAVTPLAVVEISDRGIDVVRNLRKTFPSLLELSGDEKSFVRKSGDEMSGPLRISATLSVKNAVVMGDSLSVEGTIRAGLFEGALGAGMVGTEQLRDASVTREKLGFELNPELPGSFVLEAGPHPPEGYRYTGAHLCAYYGDPKWPVLEQKEPSPGPAAAVAHRGHIYMLQVSGEFWRFNDRTGVWTRLENPYPPRSGFAMACAHGTIYVFGGLEDGKIAAVTRSYNLGTGEWRELGAMPCPRSGMAVAEHEGRIHLIGGEVRSLLGRKPSTVHATFNSATGKWSELEHLPKPRAYASAVVLRDRIHVVGGERAGFLGRAATAWHEEYHAASDQWIVREPLRVPATRLACGAIGGRIHAFGGEQPGLFARALIRAHQEYDPAMNWWLEKPPLPVACGGLSVVSDDNTLIAVGGRAHRREGLPMAYVLGSVFCVHRKF